jgi:hypothetical protein
MEQACQIDRQNRTRYPWKDFLDFPTKRAARRLKPRASGNHSQDDVLKVQQNTDSIAAAFNPVNFRKSHGIEHYRILGLNSFKVLIQSSIMKTSILILFDAKSYNRSVLTNITQVTIDCEISPIDQPLPTSSWKNSYTNLPGYTDEA